MVPVGQAAGRLRVDRVKLGEGQRRVPLPALSEGEKLIAAFLGLLVGVVVVNNDNQYVVNISRDFAGRKVTYAIDANADYRGTNVRFRRERCSASLSWMCAESANITAQRSRVAGVA